MPITRRLPPARVAALALLLATVFWGCGFTWAQDGGKAINDATGQAGVGPILLLAIRFGLGALVWFICFPAARRGWSWQSVGRSACLGSLLGSALIMQHLGLDRTSVTVTAFLTSLTILFVPLLMALALRRPPRPAVWLGIILATVGIWRMTWATPAGFHSGEKLGLACSIVFSMHIIALNVALPHDSPWRMTGGQFATIAVLSLITCFCMGPAGRSAVLHAGSLALAPGVRWNAVRLTVVPTLLAFGIMTHFQPRIDASRAAIIYLMEPVFAAVYALGNQHLEPKVWTGAALILIANAMVEVLEARSRAAARDPAEQPVVV